MTELIKGGPYIPGDLMNLLEDGQVVFFCGAGVSIGTDLPTFAGLVQHAYTVFGTQPDAVELEALDLPQDADWDNIDLDDIDLPYGVRHHPKYDKVLELLERPKRHGRSRPDDPSPLRQAVIERLSWRVKGRLDIHRALLKLSTTSRGIRLVTTNFDTRFESAARGMKLKGDLFDAAPKLPLPKLRDWHTCVHLHGVIDRGARGDGLVLTAADFGRAYLTDRWAARFVTELFRDFHVVFIGYGLGDPVMTYLVDALAAERAQGRPLKEAYAFAAYDGTPNGADSAERAWLAKNVKPILYANHNKHRLLRETLVEWARIRDDPFEARKHIVLRDMTGLPDGADGPATRNVVWSLNDPVAAQALADSPPIINPDMYPKLIAWLDILWEKGLFERPLENDQLRAPLVGGPFRMHGPISTDNVGMALCRWISNHLHVPNVLQWIIRRGGLLHHYLRDEIRRKLADEAISADPDLKIDPRLRSMWTILVNQQIKDFRADLWLPEQYAIASATEKERIVEIAMQTIAPQMTVLPGTSSEIQFRKIYDSKAPDPDEIEACAHLKVVVGNQDDLHLAEEVLKQPGVLGSRAFILTAHLNKAIALLNQSKEWCGDTCLERPSIADHAQNQDREKWAKLISFARDSYFQLAKKRRSEATALLKYWSSMGDSVFHRLALHAITEDPKSDIGLVEPILLGGHNIGLWDDELRREVLRLFRKAGKRIPRHLVTKLVQSITAGPPYGQKGSEDWKVRLRAREIGLRLGKLKLAKVKLNKAAEKHAISTKREKETPNSHRDEFHAWGEEMTSGDFREFDTEIPEIIAAKEMATKITGQTLPVQDFKTQLKLNLLPGLFALIRLARVGSWPIEYWRELVWHIGNMNPDDQLQARRCTLSNLFEAPDALIEGLGTSTARILNVVARLISEEDEQKFFRLWGSAWKAVGPTERKDGWDRMTQALNDPAGKLAEAALSRLWLHKPEANKGLPRDVRPYFEAIGAKHEDILGRVIFVRFLNNLFLIDREWTRQFLVAPMTQTDLSEARDLWTAYGYSPRISPNLLHAIKQPFFSVLNSYDGEGRTDNNLVSMFMSVCLDLPNELTTDEIKSVTQNLPEGALAHVAHVLERRLIVAKEERATAWKEKIYPWLRRYWPTVAGKNTKRTSEALTRMVMEAGEAFPEAVNWGEPYLKPIGDHVYFRLNRSNLPTEYPDASLQLLVRITPEDGYIQWEKPYFREALDAIKAAKPMLGNSPLFLRLYRLATI